MSSVGSIEIGMRLAIEEETAQTCLRIAALYAQQSGCVIALEPGAGGFEYRFKEVPHAD